MTEPHLTGFSGGGTSILSVLEILKRLTAGLHLLRLADDVIPKLVADDSTMHEHAHLVLAQIPVLRRDIDLQVEASKALMNSIQDRVEAIAQFLLLHRKRLSPAQSEDLDRWLAELRG